MVFPILVVGALMLAGAGVKKVAKAHEDKKSRRRREVEAVSEDNIPRGFAPQPALLFDYPLNSGEHLIATFAFTPCTWAKKLGSANMIPHICGSTMGIGHITSTRVLLFYDIKKIHGKASWDGEQVELLGKYGSKLLEHGVNETVGRLLECCTRGESETRKHMEKIAKHHGPYGVVTCERGGEWALAYGCIFSHYDDHLPNKPATFAPAFIDDSASGDVQGLFAKLLGLGGVDVEIESEDEWPYYGTSRELKLDPICYTACTTHAYDD